MVYAYDKPLSEMLAGDIYDKIVLKTSQVMRGSVRLGQ
jgi:hypothetical protein